MTNPIRRLTTSGICAAVLTAAAFGQGIPVTLQWFETSWQTMEDRTADAFIAGYGRVWTPPPTKSDGGTSSAGYNLFDRFDLGSPGSPTRYGTITGLRGAITEQDKACIGTFIDLILNHNSFSDKNTSGFQAAGGYPGFVLTWGGDTFGDFHDYGISCDTDPVNCRTSNLIDIAQEKNYVMIRQPTTAGDPQNIPAGTVHNQPNAANAQFYPDPSLPANSLGIHPFNTSNPMAGVATAENGTGLLLRWTRWLLEVVKVDGFRIDAAKHIPSWFFSQYYDAHVWGRGQKDLSGNATTPYSFVEVYDGNWDTVYNYVCKNGNGNNCNTSGGVVGNRDALDFPLYWAMTAQLNGSGYGNWGSIVGASIDGRDGNANDGSLGVQFASAHDSGLPPPSQDNLAYAYILTRAGSPNVYFQAGEFGTVSFPAQGRGDALGGQFGNLITTLVGIHNEYVRGDYVERWRDNPSGNVLVFERSNACLVGLNTRMDNGYDQRTVQTDFASGTRLKELTGNATDATVDPGGDIWDVVTVDGTGQVTIRVPRNRNTSGTLHNKGYVVYGPFNPTGTLTLSNVASTLPPDSEAEPNGTRRLASISVIQANSFDVQLQTVPSDTIDTGYDDLARLRIDAGMDLNGNATVDVLDGIAVDYGYENFLTQNVSLKTAMQSGGSEGIYRQTIDATTLSEGRHYLSVMAYRSRPAGTPPIFKMWRQVFIVDRTPPSIALISPAPGTQITTSSYQIVVQSADRTATRAHMFMDYPAGTDLAALADAGQGLASQTDRDRFARTFTNLAGGNHRLDVVAYEATRTTPGITTFHLNQRFGDFDGDTDVDQEDFGYFQACLKGSVLAQTDAACANAMLNPDGYVDQVDFNLFQACMSGPGNATDTNCARGY